MDGTKRSETGSLKAVRDDKVIEVQGSYSFTAPDGKLYKVFYEADENGYRIVKEPEDFSNLPQGLPAPALASLVG